MIRLATLALFQIAQASRAGTIWEHIPPEIMAVIVTVLVTIFGGIIAIALWLFRLDRSKESRQIHTLWTRLDEIDERGEATQRKTDLLEERIRHIPDLTMLQEKMDALEERLEEKLEKLATRLERALERRSLTP